MERMALPKATWQDVLEMPDDGNRYEAIGGKLYVTPPPLVRHQTVQWRLIRAIDRLLVEPGFGRGWCAPTGIEFPDTEEGVQPDIVFVASERADVVSDKWLIGAPTLVVEILSPTTARRDRSVKLDLYQRKGVEEYWLVDPHAGCVDVCRFEDGARIERYRDRLPVRLGDEIVGDIDLLEIFAPG